MVVFPMNALEGLEVVETKITGHFEFFFLNVGF